MYFLLFFRTAPIPLSELLVIGTEGLNGAFETAASRSRMFSLELRVILSHLTVPGHSAKLTRGSLHG